MEEKITISKKEIEGDEMPVGFDGSAEQWADLSDEEKEAVLMELHNFYQEKAKNLGEGLS